MANTISTTGISPGQIIKSEQVLRIIYALNGVSGSTILMSGSLGVTGSADFLSTVNLYGGATGSLFGTASYAITASYALNAGSTDTGSLVETASFSNPIITFTKGDGTTFLINLTDLVPATASLALTASYFSGSISNAISSSYALTASYVANVSSFPYTGSAIISGSLAVTGSTNLSGSLFVNGLLVGAETGGQLAIWRYTSSLSTGIDPGNGYFKLNQPWSSSPTSASFDNFAYDPNVSFSGYLDNLTIGTIIKLVSLNESGTYKLLQVTSVAPSETGYESYGVIQLTSAGNDPNENDQFAFIPVGSPGEGFETINNPGPGRLLVSDGSSNAATASVNLIYTGSTFFITGSTTVVDIYSEYFYVRNKQTEQPVLTVSESIVQFATQSSNPVGPAPNGGIWFTSTNFYVGLD